MLLVFFLAEDRALGLADNPRPWCHLQRTNQRKPGANLKSTQRTLTRKLLPDSSRCCEFARTNGNSQSDRDSPSLGRPNPRWSGAPHCRRSRPKSTEKRRIRQSRQTTPHRTRPTQAGKPRSKKSSRSPGSQDKIGLLITGYAAVTIRQFWLYQVFCELVSVPTLSVRVNAYDSISVEMFSAML